MLNKILTASLLLVLSNTGASACDFSGKERALQAKHRAGQQGGEQVEVTPEVIEKIAMKLMMVPEFVDDFMHGPDIQAQQNRIVVERMNSIFAALIWDPVKVSSGRSCQVSRNN